MKNFIQPGHVFQYDNSSGSTKLSGSVVMIGNVCCILSQDVADGASGPANAYGVFSVTKVGSQAWAKGDPIFWDKTNLRFTKTASSDADTAVGVAFEVAGSGAGVTTGYLLLLPGYGKKAAAVADEATVDGSDATTTQALANALKVKVNALLASLRAAGVIDT